MTQELFTNVRIFPVSVGNIKANGKVVVAGVVEVSFKIIEGKNGLFASLPSTKGKDDNYYQDVKLLDKDNYESFQKTVLEAYANPVVEAPKVKSNQPKLSF